jgi:glycerol-3-phosphate dehydrogenase (NAD(P)+)
VISAVKGMIPDENLLIGQYFLRHFDLPEERFLLIGGPCHAEEVAQEKLSYLTISGHDSVQAESLAAALRNRYIHASVSEDTEGTEYAAIMKNIYAVAGGIAHGLGYGDNFMAVLVSNAIIELKQFLRSIYPVRRDIKGSAYLGDLLVTAYSQYSRNRTFGMMLGKGYSVRSAQLEMNMVAEGYYAARSIHEINRLKKCVLPIAETVYRILYEGNPPRVEFQKLSQLLR